MSTENSLHLAKDFKIPVTEYASQGNAVLGIRDAGKTFTAMKAAEELLENDIPIIVYDPVGVWKNLKNGTGKHKGYPIVVAGGEGSDIRLTPTNAVDIVRAAMKENISIVFDLYAPELINKSTWIKIVQETVDALMYENKNNGLRHIFLEEAAEFIPQRLQPQHSRVYASIERVARMGRNARLGLTLINQRAEEVNKAILEICAFSLLHKQVGKNSLLSIQRWLEIRQVNDTKEIIKSLPTLQQGECWAIGLTDQPQRIKISPRNTFHPDPRKGNASAPAKLTIDVSGFVEKMNKQLKKEPEQKLAKAIPINNLSVAQAKKEIESQYTGIVKELNSRIKQQNDYIKKLEGSLAGITKIASGFSNTPYINGIQPEIKITPAASVKYSKPPVERNNNSSSGLPTGELKILSACAQYPNGLLKEQLTVITAYKRSSRDTYIQRLMQKNLIEINDSRIIPTKAGIESLGSDYQPLPTGEELQTFWLQKLPEGERKILALLIDSFPSAISRDDISEKTNYMRSSRDTYIQRMAAKELINIEEKGWVKASKNLFN